MTAIDGRGIIPSPVVIDKRDSPIDEVTIVTFANDSNVAMLKNLIATMNDYHYRYQVIGQGVKWTGFMTKITAYRDYAQQQPQDSIIAIIDGYDMFCTGPPSELITRYKAYNKPIVVGAETYCGANCIPVKNWWSQAQEKQGKVRHCNSGFIMGRSQEMVMMLNYMMSLGIDDDQIAFCTFAERYPSLIALDTASGMVANVTPVDFHHVAWDDTIKRITYRSANTTPCFVHTPGRTGDLMIRTNFIGRSVLGERYIPTSLKEFWRDYSGKVPVFFERNFISLLFGILILFIIFIALAFLAPSLMIPTIALLVVMFAIFAAWYIKVFG